MKEYQIDYQEMIDLGAEVNHHSDGVFFRQHGYKWFTVEINLTKTIYISWDCETLQCQMIRLNNKRDCDIKARHNISDLSELKYWVAFFSKK